MLDYLVPPSSPNRLILAKRLLSAQRRMRIYRKLSSLLANDVKQELALAELLRRARTRNVFSEDTFLSDMLDKIRAGQSLGGALRFWAPVEEVLLVSAGERQRIETGLDEAANIIVAKHAMLKAMRNALAYPIFLVVMLFVLIITTGKVVLPRIISFLDLSQARGETAVLTTMHQIVDSWMFAAFMILLAVLILVICISLPRWTGPLRVIADRFPPWSFYRLLVGGGWLLSLASLIKTGVITSEALEEMRRVAMHTNPYLYERLDGFIRAIGQGLNLGEALDVTGFEFPDPELVEDLLVYSKAAQFDDILQRIAHAWITDGVEAVKTQAAIVNISATVLIGSFLVGFVSLFMGVYQQILTKSVW